MPIPEPRTPVGFSMFLMYLLLYGGFIALNVLRPDVMALRVQGVVSIAVVYGMLLIIVAALLALMYVMRSHR
jgi:uncharacterized membrane protein (DUF485 family)